MKAALPEIAIIYDFDGTLAPGNMQEYDFIPRLGVEPAGFWAMVKAHAREQRADPILAYMCLMLEKAASGRLKISREAFRDYGRHVTLFPGVQSWFGHIERYGHRHGFQVRHYIISSGLVEMIEGTSIARHFTRIFASSFSYDANGVAHWPGVAVNYTTKTQFMFRINKGVLDISDTLGVNAYVPRDQRPVPFERMIYIGDGETDVPCMRLLKDQGGHSLAVFDAHRPAARRTASQLLADGRVHGIAPADYRPGKRFSQLMEAIIDRLAADRKLTSLFHQHTSTPILRSRHNRVIG